MVYMNDHTIPENNNINIKTVKFDEQRTFELLALDLASVPPHPQFWCLGLTIVDIQVQMVISMFKNVMLGRLSTHTENHIFIDLSGYNAFEYGVSRNHAILSLSKNRVYITDNNSTNHTLLNGKKLQPLVNYQLKPGDLVTLGRFELKTDFLFDPFNT